MKNSGVEWIGEIPDGWEVKKLKYICDPLASGGTPDSNNDQYYCENGTNWVAINDMSLVDYVENTAKHITNLAINEKKLKIYPKGTIIYSIYATLGHVAELSKPACINQALLALSIKDKSFNKSYFKYSLNAMKEYVLAFSSGNTQFNLNAQKVRNFTLLTPSFETQQRIASYLDKKCNKIEETIQNQQQVIEKLKAYKQSLITEAVTGKVKIENGKIKGTYESYKESGVKWIGKIPSEWEVEKSNYIFKKIGDIDHDMPESVENGIPYLMTGDLRERVSLIDFSKCKQVSEIDYQRLSKKMISRKGDILFARYATIGTVSIVDIDKQFLVSYSCVTIRPNSDFLHSDYLFYYFKSKPYFEEIKQFINSNTQGNVGIDSMKKAKIIVPNIKEQISISNYLDKKCTAIDTVIEQKQNLIEKLTEYKKSLIYECVTGKKEI